MAQLKAMINGLSDQKPEKPAPRAEAAPAAETEPAEGKKKPSGAPLPAAVFAAVKETAPELQPEPVPQPEKRSGRKSSRWPISLARRRARKHRRHLWPRQRSLPQKRTL